MTTPAKKIVKLVVKSDIPYLRVGKKYAKPHDPKEFLEIPVAAATSEQLAEVLEQAAESDDEGYQELSSPTDTTTEGSSASEEVEAGDDDPESDQGDANGVIDEPNDGGDDAAEEEQEREEIFDEGAERVDPEYIWEDGEYNSYLHTLTHLPRKPNCPSCQLAKMKEKFFEEALSREYWENLVSYLPLTTFIQNGKNL